MHSCYGRSQQPDSSLRMPAGLCSAALPLLAELGRPTLAICGQVSFISSRRHSWLWQLPSLAFRSPECRWGSRAWRLCRR